MFFGVSGLSGLRILLSYFWPAPLQRKKEKKVRNFFFDRQWVQTSAKPLCIEIEIEKSRFLVKKFGTQITPKSAMSCLAPLQCRAAAVRIDAPPNDRQFRKNREKNVPELHLVAIFCEKQ